MFNLDKLLDPSVENVLRNQKLIQNARPFTELEPESVIVDVGNPITMKIEFGLYKTTGFFSRYQSSCLQVYVPHGSFTAHHTLIRSQHKTGFSLKYNCEHLTPSGNGDEKIANIKISSIATEGLGGLCLRIHEMIYSVINQPTDTNLQKQHYSLLLAILGRTFESPTPTVRQPRYVPFAPSAHVPQKPADEPVFALADRVLLITDPADITPDTLEKLSADMEKLLGLYQSEAKRLHLAVQAGPPPQSPQA
ncbi:MAG: hypothetical protein KAT71_02185 [Gammaproteobacteria bacterium]|nr:hypothetical protein [Gammaproteobacteria bacterium]